MLDDDVFDDVDGGADFREWDREARVREDNFVKLGYRDGVTAGKEAAAQGGFNAGFRESCGAGFRWGHARGLASVLSSLPPDVACYVRLPSAPHHSLVHLARVMVLSGGKLGAEEESGGGGGRGSGSGASSAEGGARTVEAGAGGVAAALGALSVAAGGQVGGPGGGEGGSTEAEAAGSAAIQAEGSACGGSTGTAAADCCGSGMCGGGSGACEARVHAPCACQQAARIDGSETGGAGSDGAADGSAAVEDTSHGLAMEGGIGRSVAGMKAEGAVLEESTAAARGGRQGGDGWSMEGEGGGGVNASGLIADSTSCAVTPDSVAPAPSTQGEGHLATALHLVSCLHASMGAPAHRAAAAAAAATPTAPQPPQAPPSALPAAAAAGNAVASASGSSEVRGADALSGAASVPAGSVAQTGMDRGAAVQAELSTLWGRVGEGTMLDGAKVGGGAGEGVLAASVVQGVHASVVAGVAALLGADAGALPEGWTDILHTDR
ncbi:hypothetical protein CLOM_g18016 [Closterium sp. NIES-68]|nr:hypothetical protein CLOM_g18016 [Closterium sp. NIES-68]GJP75394.1 hypothetical protein CLOP_g5847 [Closterium sp. NIES-67]